MATMTWEEIGVTGVGDPLVMFKIVIGIFIVGLIVFGIFYLFNMR